MRNRYRVPKKYWTKIGPVGRHVFNDLYGMLISCQDTVTSSQALIPKKEWRVIAWNTAWLAAAYAKVAAREAATSD